LIITAEDFNSTFSVAATTTIKKIGEEIEDMNNTLSHVVTYRTIHPTIAECTFFSSA
jgi:hypothetical protein